VAFLNKVDCTQYGKLLEDLKNNYLMGQNNYQLNLIEAYNLVVNWQQDPQNMVHYGAGINDGVVFAHSTEESNNEEAEAEVEVTLANNGKLKDRSHIACFKCNKCGHYHTQRGEKDTGNKKEKTLGEC
jgi:hypothetical protein